MHRRISLQEAGQFFITVACFEHQLFFDEPALLSWLSDEILGTLQHAGIYTPAWSFMPNHYHLLIQQEEQRAFSELLGKRIVAYQRNSMPNSILVDAEFFMNSAIVAYKANGIIMQASIIFILTRSSIIMLIRSSIGPGAACINISRNMASIGLNKSGRNILFIITGRDGIGEYV